MKQRSAKEFLLISWLVPMVCTVVGGCALTFGLSYVDYANYRHSEQERLAEIAPTIGRRIVAELLLGEQGTLGPVISQLKTEYSLNRLEIQREGTEVRNSPIHVRWGAPLGNERKYVIMEREARGFSTFIRLRHFLLALFPTILMAAIGFFLQLRFLRLHFIQPIEALAATSVGERQAEDSWPVEIRAIAQRLAGAFSNREQAIFGQVARGIIHDIRTNLHPLITATQLVDEAKDSDARKARLEKLHSASSRNLPKIKSILDLSLDTSREISLKPKLADVGETVAQSLATLAEMAQAKGVHLESRVDGVLYAVHDPVQLERVVVNLLKNGIEATDEAEAKKHVRVGVRDLPQGLAIEVEDSGPGLPDPSSIFRPLKSSKTHGVGLGLFVSKKIIEAHNGRLEPGTSEALGGAKFTIFLPLEEQRP